MLAPLALLKAHPKGAAIAGVAGVGGLVLLRRRKSATNGAGQSTDGTAGSIAAAQQSGTGVYDSTASDVYSSLEPAIEGLYGQVSALQDQIGSGVTQLDTTHPPIVIAPNPHPDMTQPSNKRAQPAKKKPAKKTKKAASKAAPSRHTPKMREPEPGRATTRRPAAVATRKPTAKPPAVKTKPAKTPHPTQGAPKKTVRTILRRKKRTPVRARLG